MPYQSWGCSICELQAPIKLRAHGMFAKRMDWLRSHYREFHPEEFRNMIKKAVKTRKLHS